jgi:hypothetical protein
LVILSAWSESLELLLAAELELPLELEATGARAFPAALVALLSPAAAKLFDAIAMAATAIRGMARGAVRACQRVFISTMIGIFLSVVDLAR